MSVSDLYIPTIDLPILKQEIVDRSWENIKRSQAYECGNWAAQFQEKEYINVIVVIVHCYLHFSAWGFSMIWQGGQVQSGYALFAATGIQAICGFFSPEKFWWISGQIF